MTYPKPYPYLRANTDGYVYLIGAPGHRLVKIGWAINPQKRLVALQSGSPLPLQIHALYATKNPQLLEGQLHRHFAKRRKHGEWFDVYYDLDQVDDAAKRYMGYRAWRQGREIKVSFTREDGTSL